jgi:hypothetical protein
MLQVPLKMVKEWMDMVDTNDYKLNTNAKR